MNVSAHTLRRLVSVTGLAAFVAVLAVPTALARPTDVDGNTMYRTQVALDVRSPDTLDATAQASASGLDPAIATAMAAHKRVQVPVDQRSPDTLDATVQAPDSGLDPAIATAMASHKRVQVPGDLRSPDALDVGIQAPAQPSGLDPAIATAMTAHGRVHASAPRVSPDARDIGVSPTIQDTSPVSSDGFNWSRFAIVLAAIGAVLVGIGTVVLLSHGKHTGHGKGAGSVTAA